MEPLNLVFYFDEERAEGIYFYKKKPLIILHFGTSDNLYVVYVEHIEERYSEPMVEHIRTFRSYGLTTKEMKKEVEQIAIEVWIENDKLVIETKGKHLDDETKKSDFDLPNWLKEII